MKKENQRRKAELEARQDLDNFQATLNRARAITVGTSFGGTTELMMRGNDGAVLWCPMQPVEVVELIHQLAANVGCHIALKPRDDFSSWREWRISEAEKNHLNGFPPFVNDMAVFQRLGADNFDQAKAEQTMAISLAQKQYSYESNKLKEPKNESLAIKKTVKRRSIKRAAAAA